MSKNTKATPSHPVNELLGDALRAVRKVREYLKPNMILNFRDVGKLQKLSDELCKTRNLAIYRAKKAGFSVKEIAEIFELTTGKVNQIIKAHPKAAARNGGE